MTSYRRQFWNGCLGNFFEHYDTALFGFLSPFLAPIIFPEQEPMTALILTYAIFPLGMLARPLGAVVFGVIGDVYGRGRALFLTLAGMAMVSGCIAFTPTYMQVGIFSPILFCIGKAMQNFLAAGETMGGAIYILEKAPEKRHDLLSSLYSASAMGGHLLASLGVYVMSQYQAVDSGWRILYLCGCITALFGCRFRRDSVPAEREGTFSNVKNVLWQHRATVVLIAVCAGFAYGTYSVALVLMNGLIPLVTMLTKAEVMKINTYLLILDFAALPLFGWVAAKVGRERVMLAVALGAVVLAVPLFLSLQGATLAAIIGVRMAFVLFGVAFFAPFHAWAQQLVPPNCRYAVISFGYALGSQLLGSPTAALGLWCFQRTGLISSVAWYWMFLGMASSLSIVIAMRARRGIDAMETVS